MGTRIFQFSILTSILIHFLMSAGVWFGAQLAPETRTADTIELEVPLDPAIQKNPEDSNGQIVEQSESVNEVPPDNAQYLSAKNQKVKQETRAAVSGQFKNDGGLGQAARKQQDRALAPKSKPTLETLTPAYQFKAAERAIKEQSEQPTSEEHATAQGEGQGSTPDLSRSNDYLPDQERGLQTMLNTREFKYFSYYSRIKTQLNQFWEPKIKQKVMYVFRQGRRIASTKDHITRLLIVLNDQGTLVTVKVLDQSGVTELDDAAIEAFREAAPFPNPPSGLIEPDGTVKIRWDFVIEA